MSAKVIILLILGFMLAGGVAGGTYFYMESKSTYADPWANEPDDLRMHDILIQPGDNGAPAKD